MEPPSPILKDISFPADQNSDDPLSDTYNPVFIISMLQAINARGRFSVSLRERLSRTTGNLQIKFI